MVEGFQHTEIGTIPSEWNVKTLREVGEVRMCRRVFNQETREHGEIPFFKIGTFGKRPDAYISKKLYDSYRQRFSFPKKGDIFISAAGTIGKILVYDGSPSYYQDSNIVWIENNETLITNEFLFHVLQAVKYNTEGGTIQRLYNNILRNTKFSCPHTRAEQSAITNVLNDADAHIKKLEQLIAKKRNIKAGALQELLKPKEGWMEKRLGEIGKCIRGVSYNSERDLMSIDTDSTIRLLRSNNVQQQIIELNEIQFVDSSRVKPIQILQKNDIVVCMANGSKQLVGKAARFSLNDSFKYTFGAFMGCFRVCSSDANPTFVFYNFLSNNYRDFIDVLLSGSSINNLKPSDIESINIPYPDLDEQISIAQILFDIDNEVYELETQLEKYKMMKQGMLQSLLTGKARLV